MLQQMRKFTKSWISTAFLFALAASFGVWGIADIFRGNTDTSVASVGGTEIDAQSFSRDLSNFKRNTVQKIGRQLTPAEASKLGHDAFQQEISETALDNAAQKMGLNVTDAQVSATIRGISAFRGPLGSFDRQTFLDTIGRANFTEASFIAEIRRELTRDQLMHAATNAAQLPEAYDEALFAFLNERRAVQYLVLPPDAAGPIPPPSDQQLDAYVKAHAASFSTPEYRALTYAEIGPKDLQNQIQVTDAQLRQTYELRKDTYNVPDKRDVQRITFPDQAAAAAARAKIGSGTSFDDIAKARGMSTADTDLGLVSQADLGPGQGPAVFALPLNGVSQPVKGTFGWEIFRVTKLVPGVSKSLADVEPALKAELTQQLAASKVQDIVNAFDDARDSGDDLAEAAKKAGMKVVDVQATDAQGLTPDGGKADVPASPVFLSQVFKSDVGEGGDPFATSDGNEYVVKVNGVLPEKLKPLDAVRAQATAAWADDQRRHKLEEKAASLAQEADRSGTLSPMAAALHADVKNSEALLRDTPTPVFGNALISKIFAVAPGKSVYGSTANGDSFIVARVSGVVVPPPMTGNPYFLQFTESMGSQLGSDIGSSMGQAARAQQGVTINQQQLDHVLGTEGS